MSTSSTAPANHLSPSTDGQSALKPAEEKALQALRAFMLAKGYAPTISEIAGVLGVSRNRAYRALIGLQIKRAIEWDAGQTRGIRIVGMKPPLDRETLRAALLDLPSVNVTTERGTLTHVALADVEALLEVK